MTYIFQAKDLFPYSGIEISQGPQSQYNYPSPLPNHSHPNYEAVDYAGAGWYKAPCPLKIVGTASSSGTIIFQSIDKILFANGKIDYLCLYMTHMGLSNFNTIVNSYSGGKTIAKGNNIYHQGGRDAGSETGVGIHVHLHIGIGLANTTTGGRKKAYGPSSKYYGIDCTGGELKQSNAFYINNFSFKEGDGTVINSSNPRYDKNSSVIRLSFKTYTAPTVSGYALITPNSTCGLRHTPAGALKMTLPKGAIIDILNFEPGFKGDGYQWAYVNYNDNLGYCQIDTKSFNYIKKGVNPQRTLYFVTPDKKTAALRDTPVGSLITTIPANTRVPVLEIYPRFERDTYQWARVNYGGRLGWSQIDTKGYNYLSF